MTAESQGSNRRSGKSRSHDTLRLVFVGLLALTLAMLYIVDQSLQRLEREVRMLGVHTQDLSAILIREGLSEPRDKTMGPTAPGAERLTEDEP